MALKDLVGVQVVVGGMVVVMLVEMAVVLVMVSLVIID